MELIATADVTCPHCGEVFSLSVDTSQPEQSLVEDCSICCRPIALGVRCRPGSILEVAVGE